VAAARRRRLDELLVERGLADDADHAARLVRAGRVLAGTRRLDKPGEAVPGDIALDVRVPGHPFVSRGGLKLAGALDALGVDPAGRVAIDLGASTGGFTDCLLQRGAVRVYAVDVGRGQLHRRLAVDPRVVSRERLHVDALEAGMFDPAPSLAVADVSFISVTRVLAPLERVLARPAEAVLLVKPQFELDRGAIPPGGVVRDPVLHRIALRRVAETAVARGWRVAGECDSPVAGGDGNREFFLRLAL
jgi:23S rRNA (cytidine1920-2'-O)/16S rRNA (cytidine1409-2'-O)-methyltransferase